MKPRSLMMVSLVAVAVAFSVHAQLNLNAITSRSVRDWKNVPTAVESLLVDTRVANGLATTTITMTLTPGAYQAYSWIAGPQVCEADGSCYSTSQRVFSGPKQAIDSIEIAAGFVLPTDWVAQEMWLWVGTEKVRAEIQDRALARGQYEEIVNRRRDPCLLEYYGNGSYHMMIFPAESYASRKVAIQFQHTFDDDSAGLITACIPITFDTTYSYYYTSPEDRLPVGYMKATLSADDGRRYNFDMSGLGEGTFSSMPLVLEKNNVKIFSAGTIAATDPSASNEYLWSGLDKDNNLATGFSMWLSPETVDLEAEPETRIIVMDVREQWWIQQIYYADLYEYAYDRVYPPSTTTDSIDVWKRAQKYAVLCLKNYVGPSQKFNLLIAGNTVSTVFNVPVSPTAGNLAKAFNAILSARPSDKASTVAAVKAAVDQAGGDIVILISDIMRPFNYQRYLYDANGRYTGVEISPEGEAFDARIDSIRAIVVESGVNLFSIEDEPGMSAIANESGGFRLASLRYPYYYNDVQRYIVDGVEKQVPQLPKLFLENSYYYYYNRGLTGLTITSSHVSDIVHTTDMRSYYWMALDGPVMMADASGGLEPAVRKSAKMVVPSYNTANETMLRVSAIANGRTNATFTISGKMGGLKFTRTVTGQISNSGSLMADNDGWAFRRAEQLGNESWYDSALVIKQIGKDYHIVTRQTSLLALEPGMEMWEDTTAEQTDNTAGATTDATGAPVSESDIAYRAAGASLDDISLEDLVNGELPVAQGVAAKVRTDIGVVVRSGALKLLIPASLEGQRMTLNLYDLKGRLVATRDLSAAETATGAFSWSIGSLGNSYYVLRANAGNGFVKSFKVSMGGR